MAKQDDNQLFANEFIRILLEQNEYGFQVLWKVFIPYVVYAITSVVYMSNNLVNDHPDGFFDGTVENASGMRVVIVGGAVIFVTIEIVQIFMLKLSYFEDYWNWFMLSSYALNLFCIFEHVYHFSGCTYDDMITIGAVAAALQWFVFYYWFRLVPTLAFFVTFL